MSSVTNPRGKLPARVYWVRRGVVLAVALLLVFGIGKLLGGGGSDHAPKAATAAAKAKATKSAFIGPVAPTGAAKPAPNPAGKPATGSAAGTTPAADAPLAAPTGPCLSNEITAVPELTKAAAGRRNVIRLRLTSTSPACTFPVSAKTLVVKITSGKDRIWSTQDCARAIAPATVVVRSAVPTYVPVSWSGRRSDTGCTNAPKWAQPGYYHAVAAALGSEPSDVQFQLGLPPRPVITKTAAPKPTPTPAAKR